MYHQSCLTSLTPTLTEDSHKFVKPLTLQALTKNEQCSIEARLAKNPARL